MGTGRRSSVHRRIRQVPNRELADGGIGKAVESRGAAAYSAACSATLGPWPTPSSRQPIAADPRSKPWRSTPWAGESGGWAVQRVDGTPVQSCTLMAPPGAMARPRPNRAVRCRRQGPRVQEAKHAGLSRAGFEPGRPARVSGAGHRCDRGERAAGHANLAGGGDTRPAARRRALRLESALPQPRARVRRDVRGRRVPVADRRDSALVRTPGRLALVTSSHRYRHLAVGM